MHLVSVLDDNVVERHHVLLLAAKQHVVREILQHLGDKNQRPSCVCLHVCARSGFRREFCELEDSSSSSSSTITSASRGVPIKMP